MKATLKLETKSTPFIFLGLLPVTAALGAVAAFSPQTGLVLLAGLPALCLTLYLIACHPYWVVLLLVAFMPFESFILKFLPVSDHVYLATQFISELLIYATFALRVFQKMITGQPLRRTPIDGPLLIFVGLALLSIVLNRAPLVGSLLNLRSLLRYVFFFYLVVNLNLTPKQVTRLVYIILFVGLLQILIGALQLASAGALNDFLLPKQVDVTIAGQTRQFLLLTRGRELGSIFGALGDTLYFGLFMLLILALYLGRLKKVNGLSILILGCIFIAAAYSYVRGVVFSMLLLLLIFYWLRYGVSRVFILLLLLLPLGVIVAGLLLSSFHEASFINPTQEQRSIVDNMTGIFSRDYIEIAHKQRLGSLLGVVPTTLVNRPILGYGPDQATTIASLNASRRSFLLGPIEKKRALGFEDVYWVALLAYYGLAGVGVLWLLLYRLYISARQIYRGATHHVTGEIAFSVICLMAITPLLLFFYRTLEFRIYSFYFWLLPALMFTLHRGRKKM